MAKLTDTMLAHLDREIADTLELARELERPSDHYPEHIRCALRLAFAAHYRALMEFFHDGRAALRLPPNMRMSKRSIRVSDLLPSGTVFPIRATPGDKLRFQAADKLAAHLARDRSRYHGSKAEWGNPKDRYALRRRTRKLVNVLRDATLRLPLTVRAIESSKRAV